MRLIVKSAYAIGVVFIFWTAFLFYLIVVHMSPSIIHVYFLDVGQGDGIYIEIPGGTNIVIDGGPDNTILGQLGMVMPWWERTIDYVVLTHPDYDHYAGIYGVIERYSVNYLLINGQDGRDEYYSNLIEFARSRGVRVITVRRGSYVDLPLGITFKALSPHSGLEESSNANSIVFALDWRYFQVLFTGDLDRAGEKSLIAFEPSLSADVLKVGHHGSKTSSDPDFIMSIKPHYCVISAGIDNRYGHPHQDALKALSESGCSVLYTFTQGNISVASDGYRLYVDGKELLLSSE